MFNQEEILSAVNNAGQYIIREYNSYKASHSLFTKDELPLLLVPLLDGALPFFNNICRFLKANEIPFNYESICCCGYDGMTPVKFEIIKGLRHDWPDHFVVVVDDILDSGTTAAEVLKYIIGISNWDKTDFYSISPLNTRFVALVRRLVKTDCVKEDSTNKSPSSYLINSSHGLCRGYSPLITDSKKWLMGFGMDINGYGRTTSEITEYDGGPV